MDETTARVLLLDDDLDVLAANARFLRLQGLTVELTDHPERALAQIAAETPDLIVTDLRMPGMDGLAFARRLREQWPLLPLLFLSGYARTVDVVEAMRLGAVDFLEKPVEPARLLAKVLDQVSASRRSANAQRLAFDLNDTPAPYKTRVQAYERYLIETSLLSHGGRVGPVLESLQINRRTLNDKMAKLGIRRSINDDE